MNARTPARAPRVGLVGARRARQGLGPFVARFLVAHGAEVPAYLGTSPASIATAAQDLRRIAALEARGHDTLDALFAEDLDALAILSPNESHERYLRAALEAGLHVLCEKPLVWGPAPSPEGVAGRARRLWEGFAERGLVLAENCQWPYVLSAFDALHPAARAAPPRRFGMRLSPASRGASMLPDALPHPLSVLQTLAPGPARVSEIGFSSHDPDAPELVVSFVFEAPEARIEAKIELVHGQRLPRDAGLSINTHAARRIVEPSDYSIYLASNGRRERVADPLETRIEDFLGDLRAARAGAGPAPDAAIVPRMQMLEALSVAFHEGAR